MTTSQKAKYIFGAILSAALFLFLFFTALFLITAFLVTVITWIGVSFESDSLNIGQLLGVALSFLFSLRKTISLSNIFVYMIYIAAFFAATFVTDRIVKRNDFLYRWTYVFSAVALACYSVYNVVMVFADGASWRYAVAIFVVGILVFNKSGYTNKRA